MARPWSSGQEGVRTLGQCHLLPTLMRTQCLEGFQRPVAGVVGTPMRDSPGNSYGETLSSSPLDATENQMGKEQSRKAAAV